MGGRYQTEVKKQLRGRSVGTNSSSFGSNTRNESASLQKCNVLFSRNVTKWALRNMYKIVFQPVMHTSP